MSKAKKNLFVSVVLDRSGSMYTSWDSTIEAFNEYVRLLMCDKEVKTKLTLMLFDSQSIDIIYNNRPIAKVPVLTRKVYIPRGMTPLYDAIGEAVTNLDVCVAKAKDTPNVALVIITDGYNNDSEEFTMDDIKTLLDNKQNRNNWLVIYLGANQDAWESGNLFGTRMDNTMSFDTDKIGIAVDAISRSTLQYSRTGNQAGLTAFTDEERNRVKS